MKSRLAVFAAAAVALAACQPSDAAFTAACAFLLAHPEVLEEASQKLQANAEARAEAAQHKAEANLPKLRSAIERDPVILSPIRRVGSR